MRRWKKSTKMMIGIVMTTAAAEIGPVGGRSFLHGFTATLAVFPRGS